MPVKKLLQKAAATGWLPAIVGKPWPVEYAGVCPFGADFDYFHELVLHDELARCGAGGVLWGLSGGLSIGLPPVLKFGSKALKDRVAPHCLSGRKVRVRCFLPCAPCAFSENTTGAHSIAGATKRYRPSPTS